MFSKSMTVIIILSINIILMIACNKGIDPPQVSLPILTTSTVSGITPTSALSGGNITFDGGAAISVRGVCWSTNPNPTIVDSKSTDGTGSGSFSSVITGLSANTTYNIRAYGTNSSGTGYGNTVTFSTSLAGTLSEYLGQTSPGKELKRFAPNIVPDWFHAEITFSPDGQEIYWVTKSGIMFTKLSDEQWTTPQLASFSEQSTVYYYDDVPVISPDNKKLFFLSKRPINYVSSNIENIWYVDRVPAGWSAPKPLPQIVNSITEIHWQISVANSGTLYYCASDKIYYSRYINGEYINPEPLQAINAFGNLTCPFIAPDESYIIFSKIVQFVAYLYISFKNKDGQWLQPQLLNGLPAPTSFVSRDGKYLFVNHHWISAEILENYKPKN